MTFDEKQAENLPVRAPQPLYNQVLLKVIQRGRTPGGLWIPETAEESIPRAIVIAVGKGSPNPDGTWRPVELVPGDVVLVQGKGLELDSKERLWFFRDDQAVAVIGHLEPRMLDPEEPKVVEGN